MRLLYIEIKNAAQHFVFSKLSKLQAFQKYFYDYDVFLLTTLLIKRLLLKLVLLKPCWIWKLLLWQHFK